MITKKRQKVVTFFFGILDGLETIQKQKTLLESEKICGSTYLRKKEMNNRLVPYISE